MRRRRSTSSAPGDRTVNPRRIPPASTASGGHYLPLPALGWCRFRCSQRLTLRCGYPGKVSGCPSTSCLAANQEKLRLQHHERLAHQRNARDIPEKITSSSSNAASRPLSLPYDCGPVNAFARHGGTFITQAELKHH
jgi:hypothetical protein